MKNRIKELREARGMTQTDLAELVGAHWQTIQRLEVGTTRLDTDWMERLAKPLKVHPADLISARRIRTVEVRGAVQAGAWAETWEWPEDDRYTVPIPDNEEYRRFSLYGAEIRGPSMDRRYPEGTVVIVTDQVERGEQLVVGRRYLLERERADGLHEATVKTLWRDDAGKLWLLPESTDPRFQEPIPIGGDEGDTLRIIGRVVFRVQKED
jgi:DNA-binding XRE family transcriptional regulator